MRKFSTESGTSILVSHGAFSIECCVIVNDTFDVSTQENEGTAFCYALCLNSITEA